MYMKSSWMNENGSRQTISFWSVRKRNKPIHCINQDFLFFSTCQFNYYFCNPLVLIIILVLPCTSFHLSAWTDIGELFVGKSIISIVVGLFVVDPDHRLRSSEFVQHWVNSLPPLHEAVCGQPSPLSSPSTSSSSRISTTSRYAANKSGFSYSVVNMGKRFLSVWQQLFIRCCSQSSQATIYGQR